MRHQHVMRDAVHLLRRVHCTAGRVLAAAVVAEHGRGPRLVEGHPELHAVAEAAEAQLGVLYEVVHDLGVQPAILLDLWEWLREGREAQRGGRSTQSKLHYLQGYIN